nr:F-box only protein 36 isoform X1 [Cavia porcellus]
MRGPPTSVGCASACADPPPTQGDARTRKRASFPSPRGLWVPWCVQIALVFGRRTLDYVFNLCKGKFDFLERLSDSLLLHIIAYLDLEDVARLSLTSRRFAKLCKSDVLWEQIVQSACGTITPDMRTLAEDMGWRQMFFTNKLQLQRQLRKRRQRQGSQQQTVILESSEKHRGSAHNCSRTWSPGPFLNRLCPPQMPKPGPGTWAGRQKASQITMFPTLLTPPPNPQERSFLYV